MNQIRLLICLSLMLVSVLFLTSCEIDYADYEVAVQHSDGTPYSGDIIIINYGQIQVIEGKVNFLKYFNELEEITSAGPTRQEDLTLVISPTEKSGAKIIKISLQYLDSGQILILDPVQYSQSNLNTSIRSFQIEYVQNNFDQPLGGIKVWIENGNYEFISGSSGIVEGGINISYEKVPVNFIFYDPEGIYETKIVKKKFQKISPRLRNFPVPVKQFIDDDDFRLTWRNNRFFAVDISAPHEDITFYQGTVNFGEDYCEMDSGINRYLYLFTMEDEHTGVKYGFSQEVYRGLDEVPTGFVLKRNYVPIDEYTGICTSKHYLDASIPRIYVNTGALPLEELPAVVQQELDERWGFFDWLLAICFGICGICILIIVFMTVPRLISRLKKLIEDKTRKKVDKKRAELRLLGILEYYDQADKFKQMQSSMKDFMIRDKAMLLVGKVISYLEEIKKQAAEKNAIDRDIVALGSQFQNESAEIIKKYQGYDNQQVLEQTVSEVNAQMESLKKLKSTLDDAILRNKIFIKEYLDEIGEIIKAQDFTNDYNELKQKLDEISNRYQKRQKQVSQMMSSHEEGEMELKLKLKKKDVK